VTVVEPPRVDARLHGRRSATSLSGATSFYDQRRQAFSMWTLLKAKDAAARMVLKLEITASIRAIALPPGFAALSRRSCQRLPSLCRGGRGALAVA
jgi:hypothetical protein